MITYLFTWVLFLSLTGLIAGGLMLGADAIFKERMHAVFRYYIWIAAVVVMLIPIRWGGAPERVRENAARVVAADREVYPAAAGVGTVAQVVNTVADTVVETNLSAKSGIVGPAPQTPEKRAVKPTKRLRIPLDLTPMEILAGIWFGGILCLLLKILAQRAYVSARLYQITQKAEPKKLAILEQVKKEMGIKRKIRLLTFQGGMTPFITGVYRNKIYIPEKMDNADLALILRHELTHCKRLDILYKAIVQLAAVIHFFNPIIYLIRRRVDKYCEISCDEQAVKNLSFQERKDYTIAVLNTVLQNRRHMRGTVALGENKSNLRERVEFIMSDIQYSKVTRTGAAAFMLAIVMVSTLFSGIVNANNDAQAPKVAYSCADSDMRADLIPAEGTTGGLYAFWDDQAGYAVYRDLGMFTDLKASWVANSKEDCQVLETLFDQENYDAIEQRRNSGDIKQELYEVALKKLEKRYGVTAHGLEGTFTVKRDGEIIADDVKGFCENLPPYEYGYTSGARAELVLMLNDFDGEDYIMRIGMNLGSDSANRYDYQKVQYDFDRSRDTKQISLGRLLEASENGTPLDVDQINQRLGMGGTRTVSNTIYMNTKTKQAECTFVSRVLDEGIALPWTVRLDPYLKGLTVNDGTISGKAGKSVDFNDWVYAREYETVDIHITGLDSGAGGQVQVVIRDENDHETVLKYEIVETPRVVTTLKGTREVSEFITEGEDVFIGTPAEQDDFDRDEHDRFYKRIIIDEEGKVLCVIPIENQQGPVIESFTQKVQNAEDGYVYGSNGYENMIRRMYMDGIVQSGLMDPLTWWITAVITPENVFVDPESIKGENTVMMIS